MITYENSDFTASLLDNEDRISSVKNQWLRLESFADENSPTLRLFEIIESEQQPETHAFVEIFDKKAKLSVGILEYVITKAGSESVFVKQLDVHLCPSIRDKVEIDEEDAAIKYAVSVYCASVFYSFTLKEMKPKKLKLYARTSNMLKVFQTLALFHKERPLLENVSLSISSRWLEISDTEKETTK